MKRKRSMLITLSVAALLGGCHEDKIQRDIYVSLDECVKDWKEATLCEPEKEAISAMPSTLSSDLTNVNSEQSANQTQNSGQSNGNGFWTGHLLGRFLGPSYNEGSRYAFVPNGSQITPTSNFASSSKQMPSHTVGQKAAMSKASVTRGGFRSGFSGRSSGG